MPFPSVRTVNELAETLVEGKDATLSSLFASPDGTAMVLDAVSHGPQYVVYQFNPGTAAPDSVSVILEQAATTGAFIGLANYGAQKWDFSGPYIKQKTLSLDDPAYRSPTGDVLIAVLTPGGETATVNALSVRTNRPDNVAPTAALTADVTSGNVPLRVSFDASASADSDGSIVEYAWDWDGDGVYDGFTDTPLAVHFFTTPGTFQVRLRVTDDQFASSVTSKSITVNAVQNSLPTASFTASPLDADPPQVVDFDASASSDADGTIVNYEWDWENDGVYDGSSASPHVSHTYTTAGPHQVRLRVTDNAGGQATATLPTPILFHGWANSADPDRPGDVGSFSSMTLIGGVPAICYFDGTHQSLKYVRAADADGSQWLAPVTVDGGPAHHVGEFCTLLETNGNPAIAYYDMDNANLDYVYSDDTGATWRTPLTLDATGDVGQYASLAAIGNLGISYYDATNNVLKYVGSQDFYGNVWNTPVKADGTVGVGNDTCLYDINGRPAISYGDNVHYYLKYVRANDAGGAAWGTPVTVDNSGFVGFQSSLLQLAGNPALAYPDTGPSGGLKFVRASDATGASWGVPQLIESVPGCGDYPSLRTLPSPGYLPAIASYNYATGDLEYLQSSDSLGATWGAPQVLDSAGDVGWYSSLVVPNNGTPGIAYYDYSLMDLKYIKLY